MPSTEDVCGVWVVDFFDLLRLRVRFFFVFVCDNVVGVDAAWGINFCSADSFFFSYVSLSLRSNSERIFLVSSVPSSSLPPSISLSSSVSV